MTMLKLRLMLWLAKQLFNLIVTWEAPGGRAVLFFANNISDLNCGTRSYVEALDQSYIDRDNKQKE